MVDGFSGVDGGSAEPLGSVVTIARDVRHSVSRKLEQATQQLGLSNEERTKLLEAGWFCIEPNVQSDLPFAGSPGFAVSYVGPQDRSPGDGNLVVSLTLDDVEGKTFSALLGPEVPPVLIDQDLAETLVDDLEYQVGSGLGNWDILALAKEKSIESDVRPLDDNDCYALLRTIEAATVDTQTIIRFLRPGIYQF